MQYPSYVQDMARPQNRPKLWMGVWSGYALAATFAVLAVAGQATGVVPYANGLYVLVLLKLATNTLALWSLRNDVAALELGGLNVAVDVIAMAGAIYLTGGPISPLFAIYVIEISVIALLTNLGITVLIAAFAWVLHAVLVLLAHLDVIPQFPAPATPPVEFSDGQIALALAYAAFVIAVPTLFLSAILRLLQRKERDLERSNAELVDAAKQKSMFMANVTHELRTPIHGILGVTEMVSKGMYGPVTEDQRQAQHIIRERAEALLRLIDDLLTLARADTGRMEVEASPLDVEQVVSSVLSSVKPMIGARDLHLISEVAPHMPPVQTDRRKLMQVLVNLLGNAIKFTPDGGRVVLRARMEEGRLSGRFGGSPEGVRVMIGPA